LKAELGFRDSPKNNHRPEVHHSMDNCVREQSVFALLVGDLGCDRLLMYEVFRQTGWRLIEARTRRQALKRLRSDPVQVVVAANDTPNWGWKAVLNDLRHLNPPPQLIVTSRTADEGLWSEVLNFGGYDVLAQDRKSVV
jgi:response regulator RpfG family c-di-GMP phosphodiesterase